MLTGELDVATIQELQDKIDEIMVPGQPIVLDLADLTFLDTSAMHCFVTTFEATGHPVVLLNASRLPPRLAHSGRLYQVPIRPTRPHSRPRPAGAPWAPRGWRCFHLRGYPSPP